MATQWTAGLTDNTVLPASTLNTIGAAWESFTPVVTQGATITTSINYCKYARIQKIVIYSFNILLTSAGTAGNGIQITLPIAAATNSRPSTGASFYDASAGTSYLNVFYFATSTTAQFINAASGATTFGAAPAVTVANGDYIFGTVTYEAA